MVKFDFVQGSVVVLPSFWVGYEKWDVFGRGLLVDCVFVAVNGRGVWGIKCENVFLRMWGVRMVIMR